MEIEIEYVFTVIASLVAVIGVLWGMHRYAYRETRNDYKYARDEVAKLRTQRDEDLKEMRGYAEEVGALKGEITGHRAAVEQVTQAVVDQIRPAVKEAMGEALAK